MNTENIFRTIFALLTFSFLGPSGFCQRPPVPSTSNEAWFDSRVGAENSGLINGAMYKVKFLGSATNPFFAVSEDAGTITIGNQIYNASLVYDISRDIIVVKHIRPSGQVLFVEPDNAEVSCFSIGLRLFKKFRGSFHEMLFDDSTFTVVARRIKTEIAEKGVSKYVAADEYYVFRNGKSWRLRWPGDLATLIESKDDRRELTNFLREHRIRRMKFTDEQLIEVSSFVSGLLTKAGV